MTKKAIPFDRKVIEVAMTRAEPPLNHTRVAATLGVPLRTWMNWMKKETIPAGYVTDVVLLLGLPEPDDLAEDVPRTPWVILRGLERVQDRLSRIEGQLGLRDGDGPQRG